MEDQENPGDECSILPTHTTMSRHIFGLSVFLGVAATLSSAWATSVPVRVSANPATSAIPARTVSELFERAKEIRFDFGGTTIQSSSNALLAELASRMVAEPDARLEIGSHVADMGNPKKELTLATKRAEVVKAALVARGVPADHLVAKGYGAEHPIAPSLTRTGRMRNDRIELHRMAH